MKYDKLFLAAVFLTLFLCAPSQTVVAQSSDQALPTPILANDVRGKIAALDLGDPRLTRHFYAFEANPGDLLITVDSRNLNGDVDIFTAVTFRPLMKTTMYATSQSSEITKGIYLRAHQILILRVEARTPNDELGTYRIHFGGTFAAFSGGIPVAEPMTAEETAPEKTDANRLSSVGATIPRPAEETAEPKPAAEKPSEETEAAKTTAKGKPATTRRTTSRNPRRGSRPAPKPAPPKKTESTDAEASKTDTQKEEGKPAATEKSAETPAATAEKPKSQELAPAGARLIIEEKDGTRIDRPMSTIRRVIIEGPAIVIVLKTGKIERVPMADVARMSIEPQQ